MLISQPNCYCLQKMRSLLKAQFQGSSAQGTCLQLGWMGPPESETSGGRLLVPAASGEPAGCEGLGRVLECPRWWEATAETQN